MTISTTSTIDFNTIIQEFLSKTLPKEAWTHEAHLITGLWHVINFGKDEALQKMRTGIKTYNESVGGINSDTSGYHETITIFWIEVLDEFNKRHAIDNQSVSPDFVAIANDFLLSKYMDRNLPLHYYSREKLFSAEARLGYIAADLKEFEAGEI